MSFLPQTTKVLNHQDKTSMLEKFIEVDAMIDTIGMARPYSHCGELIPEFIRCNTRARIKASVLFNSYLFRRVNFKNTWITRAVRKYDFENITARAEERIRTLVKNVPSESLSRTLLCNHDYSNVAYYLDLSGLGR